MACTDASFSNVLGLPGNFHTWRDQPSFNFLSRNLASMPALEARDFFELNMRRHPSIVNSRDPHTGTSLLQVAAECQPQLLELLLNASCRVGLQPALDGRTALHSAILRGDSYAVRTLLTAFCSAHAPAKSLTLVMKCLEQLCTKFPVAVLDASKQMELQDEHEIFNGADIQSLVPLDNMHIVGSNLRCPFGCWDDIIGKHRISVHAADHAVITTSLSTGFSEASASLVGKRTSSFSSPSPMKTFNGHAHMTAADHAAQAQSFRGRGCNGSCNSDSSIHRGEKSFGRGASFGASFSFSPANKPPKAVLGSAGLGAGEKTSSPSESPRNGWFVPLGALKQLKALLKRLLTGKRVITAYSASVKSRQQQHDEPLFSAPPASGWRAQRVALQHFAGYYGTTKQGRRPSALQLVVQAAGHTRDFSVFSSVMIDVLLNYKWKVFIFAFRRELVFFLLHLVFSTAFIMYSSMCVRRPRTLGSSLLLPVAPNNRGRCIESLLSAGSSRCPSLKSGASLARARARASTSLSAGCSTWS